MRLFGSFNRPDIHQGLQEFRTTLGALLLDVRTPEEFREGRIPGSRNLPLQNLDKSHTIIENEHVPVYLYCHSGARSARAAAILRGMGYTDVKDLGGINAYRGEWEG